MESTQVATPDADASEIRAASPPQASDARLPVICDREVLSAPAPPMDWAWPLVWRFEGGGAWRVAATLGLCAGGVIIGLLLYTLVSLHGLHAFAQNRPPYVKEVTALVGTTLVTGFGLLGCLAGIRFVHRKPVACVFTDGRSFGIGLALQSAALWVVLWFAFTLPLPHAWEHLLQRFNELPASAWPILVLAMLIAMTMGRATEEIVFRGYLQTRLAAWMKRPWLAVCLTALVFNLLHRGNLAAHTAILLFGIVWGVAAIRAGTLAPMIGAHVAHDALSCLLQPGDGNASATWLEVWLIAGALALWLGWLFWATRNRPDQDHRRTPILS